MPGNWRVCLLRAHVEVLVRTRRRSYTSTLWYRTDDSYQKKAKELGGRPNTWSVKVDCPGIIALGRKVKKDGSVGPWMVKQLCVTHNHLIATYPRQIRCPRLTSEEKEEIASHARKGIAANLLQRLFQDSRQNTLTYAQVHAAIKAVDKDYENGRSDVKTLEDQMNDEADLFYTVSSSTYRKHGSVHAPVVRMY